MRREGHSDSLLLRYYPVLAVMTDPGDTAQRARSRDSDRRLRRSGDSLVEAHVHIMVDGLSCLTMKVVRKGILSVLVQYRIPSAHQLDHD